MHTPSHDLLVRNACSAVGNAAFHSSALYAQLRDCGAIALLVRVLRVSRPRNRLPTCSCHGRRQDFCVVLGAELYTVLGLQGARRKELLLPTSNVLHSSASIVSLQWWPTC